MNPTIRKLERRVAKLEETIWRMVKVADPKSWESGNAKRLREAAKHLIGFAEMEREHKARLEKVKLPGKNKGNEPLQAVQGRQVCGQDQT